MKNFTKIIIIGCLISVPMISNAQFATNAPFNTYGFTFPATEQKIGIGNFPTNGSVQAKLHVSQFLLANNPATAGLMFRTDGSNTVDNAWLMFTGATSGSVTEKFRVAVPANDSAVTLQATMSDLILADSKNQITLQQIIQMQQQIALLEKKLAQLEILLAEK